MAPIHRPARRTILGAWLGASVVALAAGCGSHAAGPTRTAATATTTAASTTTSPPSTTSSTAPSTTAAPSTTTPGPGGPAACATSQLRLASGGGEGAGGSSYTTYLLINASSSTCTLTGYPGVSVLDQAGAIVQHPAIHTTTPATGRTPPPSTVTLPAGGESSFLLTSTDNVPNPDCAAEYHGVTLQVFPPNQTEALDLPGTYSVCDLEVSPVEAGPDPRAGA